MDHIIFAVFLAIMQAVPPVPRKAANNAAGAASTAQQDAGAKDQNPKPSWATVEKPESAEKANPKESVRPKDAGNTVRITEPVPVSVLPAKRDWVDWAYWLFGLAVAGGALGQG